MNMNPYTSLSSGSGTEGATTLGARLSAWHDAMVAHARGLRAGTVSDACDDDCPHAEAVALWSEAVATFGARAQELIFLRARAQEARRSVRPATSTDERSETTGYARRRGPDSRPGRATEPSVVSATTHGEW